MANNRMYILCKICGEKKMLAKYYPSGGLISKENAGWFMARYVPEELNAFFEAHNHGLDTSTFGGSQYAFEYETSDINLF